MILGSHNSMTYLKPSKWYQRLARFCYRNQSISLCEQIKAGVCYFDIRVRKNKDDKWVFAHGLVEFKFDKYLYDIYEYMYLLNVYSENNFIVKLTLEITKPDIKQEEQFKTLCINLKYAHSRITFVGGTAKYDWNTKIYDFRNTDFSIHKYKSAERATVMPIIHSILNNEKYLKTYKNTDRTLVLDFIKPNMFK